MICGNALIIPNITEEGTSRGRILFLIFYLGNIACAQRSFGILVYDTDLPKNSVIGGRYRNSQQFEIIPGQ